METHTHESMRQERMAILRAYAMSRAAYEADCADKEHDKTNERCRLHVELLENYRNAVVLVVNYGRKKFRKICERENRSAQFDEIERTLLNAHSAHYMSKHFAEYKVIDLILKKVTGIDD